jgi:hypothetical protein
MEWNEMMEVPMNTHSPLWFVKLTLVLCLALATNVAQPAGLASASSATGPYIVFVGGTFGGTHNWTPWSNTVRHAEIGRWDTGPRIGDCTFTSYCGYHYGDDLQVVIEVGSGGLVSFDWWMQSTIDRAFDWVDIYLSVPNRPIVFIVTHANPACPSGYLCSLVTSPVTHITLDLTPYANQQVRLIFDTMTTPLGGVQGAATKAFVDNLQVGDLPSAPYLFTGFLSPLKNPPALNGLQAGKAVSVKFSLNGYQGPNIMAPDYPATHLIDCNTGVPLDNTEQTVDWDRSNLLYRADTGNYVFGWKSNPAWAGTCRQLVFRLDDGTTHRVNFQFK